EAPFTNSSTGSGWGAFVAWVSRPGSRRIHCRACNATAPALPPATPGVAAPDLVALQPSPTPPSQQRFPPPPQGQAGAQPRPGALWSKLPSTPPAIRVDP